MPNDETMTRVFTVLADSDEEAVEIASKLAREAVEAEGYEVVNISVKEIRAA